MSVVANICSYDWWYLGNYEDVDLEKYIGMFLGSRRRS